MSVLHVLHVCVIIWLELLSTNASEVRCEIKLLLLLKAGDLLKMSKIDVWLGIQGFGRHIVLMNQQLLWTSSVLNINTVLQTSNTVHHANIFCMCCANADKAYCSTLVALNSDEHFAVCTTGMSEGPNKFLLKPLDGPFRYRENKKSSQIYK